jgi:hypothetical protein
MDRGWHSHHRDVEVFPVGVVFLDQPDFPVAAPALQRFSMAIASVTSPKRWTRTGMTLDFELIA